MNNLLLFVVVCPVKCIGALSFIAVSIPFLAISADRKRFELQL